MNAWLPQNAKSELVDLVWDVNTSSILKAVPVWAAAVPVNIAADTATAASSLNATLMATPSTRRMPNEIGAWPITPSGRGKLGTPLKAEDLPRKLADDNVSRMIPPIGPVTPVSLGR